MILKVSGLTKHFGGLTAVDSLDFCVGQNETVSIIGPNGAGKTTVFNLISGFYVPDEGSIEFMGTEMVGKKPYARCLAGIGRVFQEVKPFRNLTVLENALVGALCRIRSVEKARQKAEECLEVVGLIERRDELASDLTIAGQKKLEMARALATEPKILLLDEVAAGLNPTEVTDFLAVVKQIRSLGIPILMIEHVMQAVMAISDRVVVMASGRKIAEGKPAEVANNPRVIEAYLGEEYQVA